MPPEAEAHPMPIGASQRIPLLDVLRGFALLGILLINMEDFSAPNAPGLATVWSDKPDQMVGSILRFAVEGKFRALFSILFGIGFALQFQRAEGRNGEFTAYYLRRAGVLLLIGIAHYLFLWEADILMTYSVVGLLLLPFARHSVKTTFRATLALAGTAVALFSLIVLIAHPRPAPAHTSVSPPLSGKKVRMVAAYSRGSYSDVVAYRAGQLGMQFARILPLAPLTLMLFLVGLTASKAGIVTHPEAHRTLLWRVFLICLCSGLIMNGVVMMYASRLMSLPKAERVFIAVSYVLGSPALTLAYISGLTLLQLWPVGATLLRPLAAPGRMALTNYLLQSLICSTLCYGYGFGWYNHLRPLVAVGVCGGIFLLEIVGSAVWMRWYRYGPVEWLWRSLTYRRLLPIRVKAIPFSHNDV